MWNSISLLHAPSLTSGNILVGNEPARIVRVPIVGSQHMGIEAYQLSPGVKVEREPDNPHDAKALKVTHKGRDIGYIPRDKQHYFEHEFSQNTDWASLPKAVSTSDSWSVFLVITR